MRADRLKITMQVMSDRRKFSMRLQPKKMIFYGNVIDPTIPPTHY